MRNLTYFVGITIDGFIADPDGGTEFIPMLEDILGFMAEEFPETIPTHVRPMMGVEGPNKQFDTVVMGRATYDHGLAEGITSPYSHLRQYVFSRSITESPDPAVAIAVDPVETVRTLKAEDGEMGIWLAGGGQIASALLPDIDALVLKHYPVVAGRGVPMFGGEFMPTDFELTDHKVYPSGAAVGRYRRRA